MNNQFFKKNAKRCEAQIIFPILGNLKQPTGRIHSAADIRKVEISHSRLGNDGLKRLKGYQGWRNGPDLKRLFVWRHICTVGRAFADLGGANAGQGRAADKGLRLGTFPS